MRTTPRATYRVQFHPGFTFLDGAVLADYLSELGVSHLYSSPCLKAVKGSTHGYDVVDHTTVNEELGGAAGYRALCDALKRHSLGLVLDIVPNHMAVGTPENRWWWDVLENGSASPYAVYFDVDWNPPEDRLANKILLPILEDHYGRVLESGKIHLQREGERFFIRYEDHRLPVSPRSLQTVLHQASEKTGSEEMAFLSDALGNLPLPTSTDTESIQRRQRDKAFVAGSLRRILREAPECGCALDETVREMNQSPDRMDLFLEQQNHRLAYWRAGAQDLGYRRFFDIDTLAGLRVEREKVFSDTHDLILKWVERGTLDGLRVDHPDGLRDPGEYFGRLRKGAPRAWIVAEKILHPGERLPASWPVEGTTGYDFLHEVSALFIDPSSEKPLSDFYTAFTGEEPDYASVVWEKKHQVLSELLGSEVNRLTEMMLRICERHRCYRDYTRHDIHAALRELVACFEVYRTYVQPQTGTVRKEDRDVIEAAVRKAVGRNVDVEADLFGFIGKVLLLEITGEREGEFVLRFQQLTGPAAAKGVEDTAFYCFNRLIGLNEVGSDPGALGSSPETFHQAMIDRVRHGPEAMLSTGTHDTKRSEDVRARLALLSEIPLRWVETVKDWSAHNERHRVGEMPDRNMEYLLYQTLTGAWPIETERVQAFALKAAREAKVHTSWTRRNEAYENGLSAFVRRVLEDAVFRSRLDAFVRPLVWPGRVNALSQLLLKLTAPGVPDIYQGCELWDHSLVDPDNRRPVDFALRRRLLTGMQALSPAEILARSEQGLPKLWVTQQTLRLRCRLEQVFRHGDYRPLKACGEQESRIVAFSRAGEVMVAVPRFPLKTADEWGDTTLEIPPGRWRHAFVKEEQAGGLQPIKRLLGMFPVLLLSRSAS